MAWGKDGQAMLTEFSGDSRLEGDWIVSQRTDARFPKHPRGRMKHQFCVISLRLVASSSFGYKWSVVAGIQDNWLDGSEAQGGVCFLGCTEYTLDLSQHGFELGGSTYTRIFFFNKYTVGPPYPQVSNLQIQLSVDWNSIFGLWLWICICGGLTLCIVLYHFT